MDELLALQIKLAEFIADPAQYKHGRDRAEADPLFSDMDLDRIALMGRLTLDKRRYKMGSLLPKTFEHLAEKCEDVLEDFATHYRPISLSGEQDARRFQEYLSTQGRAEFGLHPALEDLAALELALWSVGRDATSGLVMEGEPLSESTKQIRRIGDLALLSCNPGVRALMNGDLPTGSEIEPLRVHIAVAKDLTNNRARVFELNTRTFELLSLLDEWTPVSTIAQLPSDLDELNELVSTGLIHTMS